MTANAYTSIIDILERRAREAGGRLAYRFLVTGDVTGEQIEWHYEGLYRRACAVAAALQAAGAAGERVLLLYPPDIEFIAGFLGCVFAGAVAVPTYPPDPTRLERTLPRLRAIARDCGAGFVLTSTPILGVAQAILPQAPELSRLQWLASDAAPGGDGAAWRRPDVGGDSLAFLQYTSGSTGSPKGVMVTHANVMHNERLIAFGFGQDEGSSGVGWLPLFHDMGLLGNVLQPLFTGFPCTLMSPLAFLGRPLRWLEAISHFRATASGGPNFAYELCARKASARDREGLDLRSWAVAFNGAEPVSAETLDRFADAFAPSGFRREAFYPCYGLAESTLIVTGGEASRAPVVASFDAAALAENRVAPAPPGRGGPGAPSARLVSSGRGLLEQRVVVVDPETCAPCAPDRVGEIWVAGPSVARGYWGMPEESTRSFAAFLAGGREGPFLRTGDLGFLRDGELYVTGRLKDVIIIRGKNHYPQDIERTVERAHGRVRVGGCACFAVDAGGEEGLCVVAEAQPPEGEGGGAGREVDEIIAAVRRAVAEAHEVAPHAVVLIRPKGLPKTSSGKVQRRACRDDYAAGRLAALGAWVDRGAEGGGPGGPAVAPFSREEAVAMRAEGRLEGLRARVEGDLCALLGRALGLDEGQVDRATNVAGSGLDSLRAMQLVNQVRAHFQVEVPLRDLFEAPTVADLSGLVEAALFAGEGAGPAPLRAEGPGPHPVSFPQERLWLLERDSDRASLYNMSTSVRVRGPLDAPALARGVREIVRRHEVLRAHFREVDGKVCQLVAEGPPFDVTPVDLRGLPPDARERELDRLQDEVARAPFDLATAPLLRAVLYRLADDEHLLLLTMHHIVSDGWSMGVMLGELSALYGAFSRGLPSPLGPMPFQYSDYSAWQIAWLTDEALAPHAAYWLKRLADAPAPLQIPHDFPRPPGRESYGRRHGATLPRELTLALERAGRPEGATLFMTTFAAFALLLHRLTGESDVVVGTPVSNRPRAEFEPLVGLFLNNLALRVGVPGGGTFRELLGRVRAATLDAYEHRHMPFDKLLQGLRRVRPPEKMPLYRLFFNMIDSPEGKLELPGLTVEAISSPDAASKMDLSVYVVDTKKGLRLEMVYDASILAPGRVEAMMRQFCGLLEQIAADPGAKLVDYAV